MPLINRQVRSKRGWTSAYGWRYGIMRIEAQKTIQNALLRVQPSKEFVNYRYMHIPIGNSGQKTLNSIPTYMQALGRSRTHSVIIRYAMWLTPNICRSVTMRMLSRRTSRNNMWSVIVKTLHRVRKQRVIPKNVLWVDCNPSIEFLKKTSTAYGCGNLEIRAVFSSLRGSGMEIWK